MIPWLLSSLVGGVGKECAGRAAIALMHIIAKTNNCLRGMTSFIKSHQ
jgi:hypothetical protein